MYHGYMNVTSYHIIIIIIIIIMSTSRGILIPVPDGVGVVDPKDVLMHARRLEAPHVFAVNASNRELIVSIPFTYLSEVVPC